jgi:hypothetical protein
MPKYILEKVGVDLSKLKPLFKALPNLKSKRIDNFSIAGSSKECIKAFEKFRNGQFMYRRIVHCF